MAVRMRLTRVGSKKNPIYRVVVADSRSPRDGKFIEIVGRYNPQHEPSLIEFDEAKVKDWLSKGAQPSEPVSRLLKAKNIALRRVSAPADLVCFLAQKIVDEPDAVRVEEVDADGDLLLRLHVADADRGKVIGRRGRIVHALRTLVRGGGRTATAACCSRSPSSASPGDGFVRVGRVGRPHGLDGSFVVEHASDEPRASRSARRSVVDGEPATVVASKRAARPPGDPARPRRSRAAPS